MVLLPHLECFGVMVVFGAHSGFELLVLYLPHLLVFLFLFFFLHIVKPLPNIEGQWHLAFRFVFPCLVFWLHIASLH